jgi:DnaJ family protein B protein 12
VFNLGGGPGIRVHQFGGGRPRRRPRDPNAPVDDTPQSPLSMLTNLLPLLILFVLPLLSSLFSGDDSSSAGPKFKFDSPAPPYTLHRKSNTYKVEYWLNPAEVDGYSNNNFYYLDKKVETTFVNDLKYKCELEVRNQNQLRHEAQGWLFPDVEKMRIANNLELRSCERLRKLGVPRS